MTTPPLPKEIVTPAGRFALHEFHFSPEGAERTWVFLHAGIMLTLDDERTYLGGDSKFIPYGLTLWPASIALAYDLAGRADSLGGKRILELGAGTGLPGIVAATLGPPVTQSDRQDVALTLCKINGRRNGLEGKVDHLVADWTDWRDQRQWDLIIGSDVLYGDALHPHLQRIFDRHLAPGGRIVLADPLRGNGFRFLEAMEASGWLVQGSKWELGEDAGRRVVGVFELQRGP